MLGLSAWRLSPLCGKAFDSQPAFGYPKVMRGTVEHYPHQLPQDEALARLRALADYWQTHYGVQTEWQGFCGRVSGKVLGIRFGGTFSVEPDHVRGQLEAGFLGERLGGRSYVLRKLAHYLDPERPLTALRAAG
jgi:hypothetical protein